MTQGLPRASRLLKRREFVRCQNSGRRAVGRWLSVSAAQGSSGRARLGLAISRKVGTAVARNRLKRRLREAFRLGLCSAGIPQVEICVGARAGAAAVPLDEIRREFWTLVRSACDKL